MIVERMKQLARWVGSCCSASSPRLPGVRAIHSAKLFFHLGSLGWQLYFLDHNTLLGFGVPCTGAGARAQLPLLAGDYLVPEMLGVDTSPARPTFFASDLRNTPPPAHFPSLPFIRSLTLSFGQITSKNVALPHPADAMFVFL